MPSTEENSGQIAPLDEIVKLKEKYRFRFVLDESHSFGVLGYFERGLAEYYGVPSKKIDIITAGMGNALASDAGFCAGKCQELLTTSVSVALGMSFLPFLPPYLASVAITAVDYLEENLSVVAKLRNNIALLGK